MEPQRQRRSMSDIRPARQMDTVVRPSGPPRQAMPTMPLANPVPAPQVQQPLQPVVQRSAVAAQAPAKLSRGDRKLLKKQQELAQKQAKLALKQQPQPAQFLDSIPDPEPLPVSPLAAPKKRGGGKLAIIITLVLIPLIAAAVAYYIYFVRVASV